MSRLQNWFNKSLLCILILSYSVPIRAQIIPDNTLGSENSSIAPFQINGINFNLINGGAQRGVNLFHSFSDFNVGDGQRVYFANPSNVQNILTRVTGGNASNILGTLGVTGAANLFLINPSGILFGKNASLDVRGSFLATTASGIKFDNQGLFSAANPEAPALLTVNPSALLFNQIQPANITNLSQAPAGVSPTGEIVTGLRVADARSLLLVGGNVNINSGALRAYEGNVEIAAVAAPGEVKLITGNNINLDVPAQIQRADVSLSNGAEINVRGANNGSIAIHAANLSLTEESKLRAGLSTNSILEGQAGNIVINSTGTTTLKDVSFVANVILEGISGKPGDVKINTGSLILDTSQINASTSGQSNAGNVLIQARDGISLIGSSIFSEANATAVGNGGNIVLESGSILLSGSKLEARSYGRGNSGNITVNARDNVTLTDTSYFSNSVEEQGIGRAGKIQIQASSIDADKFSFVDNSMLSNAIGTGGGIFIDTKSLTLQSGTQLGGRTSGSGNLGDITIKANNITFKDSVPFPDGSGFVATSGIFMRVENQATGNAGNVSIQANKFSISDQASITSTTRGQGNAGNISIQADQLELVRSFAALNSSVQDGSSGRGGNIQLQTGLLSFKENAGIDSSTVGAGNAGVIIIDTDSLTMERPASSTLLTTKDVQTPSISGRITANTTSSGKGGDVTINVRNNIYTDKGTITSAVLDGGSSIPEFRGTGNGGNISITAGSLTLVNNSSINTQSTGQANAGNVFIKAQNDISLDSKSIIISSLTPAANDSVVRGQAGNIDIDAHSLFVKNGASLVSATSGQGNAGQIKVNTTEQVVIGSDTSNLTTRFFSSVFPGATGKGGDIQITTGSLKVSQGSLLANTAGNGDAGNITINANSLLLKNGGQINTATDGRGNAGKININASDTVSFDGVGNDGLFSGVYSFVGNNGIGKGGDIKITGNSLSINRGGVNSSSFGQGATGDIDINSATVRLNAGFIAAITSSGNGGNIKLTADDFLLLRQGSVISTTAGTAFSGGDGGNIGINTPFVVAVLKENSDITANAFTGKGGNVNLTVQTIFGIEPRANTTSLSDITASSAEGLQGQITITQPEIQPTQELQELPEQFTDASNQIGQTCPRGASNAKPLGEFTITGRGSLPPSPLEPLPGTIIKNNLIGVSSPTSIKLTEQSTKPTPTQIIEAQAWVKGTDGNITLVATAPYTVTHTTNTCQTAPKFKRG